VYWTDPLSNKTLL